MTPDQERRAISAAYAREKLQRMMHSLETYNSGDFWREMSRIAEGATGIPHAESLKRDLERAERKLRAVEEQATSL